MGRPDELSPGDEQLLGSVPEPQEYDSSQDRKAVEAFKGLTKKQQLKVLQRLGVNEDNPFTVSGEFRQRLLDVVAEVAFGVDSPKAGSRRYEISTPSGHGRRTKKR